MPDLLDRNRAPDSPAQAADDPRPLALTAVLAASWSAGAGLVLCVCAAVIGWFVGSTGSVTDAVRVGADAWLLGQGGGLLVNDVTVTAMPLGLTLLSATLLWRTSRWAASAAQVADGRTVAAGTTIVTSGFALIATLTAVLAGTEAVAASPGRTFVASVLLAAPFAGLGMLRGADLLDETRRRLPEDAQAALLGGLAGVLVLLAAGALLVSAALVADFGTAANLAHAMQAGAVGGALLTLAGVLVLPNASLLGVSYILGPGFSLGTDTVVAPTGVTLGRVPTFPLLAALPGEGSASWWTACLFAVPLLAGLLAGLVALRHHPVFGLDHAGLRGSLAGLFGGVATGALTGLAGGSVGPGRMAETGPEVLACIVTAATAMALGGGLGGVLACWRARHRVRRSG